MADKNPTEHNLMADVASLNADIARLAAEKAQVQDGPIAKAIKGFWDALKHPRHPKGTPDGGKFKGEGGPPKAKVSVDYGGKQHSLFDVMGKPQKQWKGDVTNPGAYASKPKKRPASAATHPAVDDNGDAVWIDYPSSPSAPATWENPDVAASFVPNGMAPASLNGVPFGAWNEAPKTAEEWLNVPGQNPALEAEMGPLEPLGNKRVGAGVVVEEPDGRIWLVAPTNGFGGYRNTFPKGTYEDDIESLQANAIKEAYEESGLRVEITGVLGDFERTTSVARMYVARRVGGTPAAMGWESQAVRLVPLEKAHSYLNNAKSDHPIIDAYKDYLKDRILKAFEAIEKAFDESKVTRWPKGSPLGGQFKGKTSSGYTEPPKIGWKKDGSGVGANAKYYNQMLAALQAAEAGNIGPAKALWTGYMDHHKAFMDGEKQNSHGKWKAQVSQYAFDLMVAHDDMKDAGAALDSAGAGLPPKISSWAKVGEKPGGSAPGGLYTDESGQKWLVKGNLQGKDEDRARNEVLASKLMAAAGIPAPEYQLVDLGSEYGGGMGVATKWEDGLGAFNPKSVSQMSAVKKQFAVHAWLGNWDVIGLSNDNMMVRPDGSLVNIDPGGSILYRAQGKMKDAGDFGNDAADWDSMRDMSKNPKAAAVFSHMSASELVASAEQLKDITPGQIADLVDAHGPSTPELKSLLTERLMARRDAILAKAEAITAAQAVPVPTIEEILAEPVAEPKAKADKGKAMLNKLEQSDAFLALSGSTKISKGPLMMALAIGGQAHGAGVVGAPKASLETDLYDESMKLVEEAKNEPVGSHPITFKTGGALAALAAYHKGEGPEGVQKAYDSFVQEAYDYAASWEAPPTAESATKTYVPVDKDALPGIFGGMVKGVEEHYSKGLVEPYHLQLMQEGKYLGKGAPQEAHDAVKTLVSYKPEEVAAALGAANGGTGASAAGAYKIPNSSVLDDDEFQKWQSVLTNYAQGYMSPNSLSALKKGEYWPDGSKALNAMGTELTEYTPEQVMAAISPKKPKTIRTEVKAKDALKPAPAPEAVKPAAPAWDDHKIPTSNQNAGAHNKKVDAIAAFHAKGDVNGILGLNYSTNTYGKKQAQLANDALASLGSVHSVAPGQKKGTHPALFGTAAAAEVALDDVANSPPPKNWPKLEKGEKVVEKGSEFGLHWAKIEVPPKGFSPDDVQTPPDFFKNGTQGNTGTWKSSIESINAANNTTVAEIYKAATTPGATPESILNMEINVLDKATGQPTGKMVLASNHPAQVVKDYHEDVVAELKAQVEPTFKTVQHGSMTASYAAAAAKLGAKAPKLSQSAIASWAKKAADYCVIDPDAAAKLPVPAAGQFKNWGPGQAGFDEFRAASSDALSKNTSLASLVKSYTGSSYDSWNNAARKGTASGQAASLLKQFSEAAQELPEGIVLHRGINVGASTYESVVGAIIQDGSLNSASYGSAAAFGSKETQLRLHIGKGVKALNVTGVSKFGTGESEIILAPNSRYAVMKVTPAKPGYKTYVDILVLPH